MHKKEDLRLDLRKKCIPSNFLLSLTKKLIRKPRLWQILAGWVLPVALVSSEVHARPARLIFGRADAPDQRGSGKPIGDSPRCARGAWSAPEPLPTL